MTKIRPKGKDRPDRFYLRLDFYRLLETGVTDLEKAAEALGVELKTLRCWQKGYDSRRGPFGGEGQLLVSDRTDKNGRKPPFVVCPPQSAGVGQTLLSDRHDPPHKDDRGEILDAMRREALEGSVPAAKLLLSEYQEPPAESTEETLTVERAVELLREWCGECPYKQPLAISG